MDTLKIVCPHCEATNAIKIEESKEDIACQVCSQSMLETKPVECDPEMFHTHLNENDIPVLVDFYSPLCTPCMEMAPDYESAAASLALEVRFIKVNTQEYPDLALKYGVNTLPTLIAFKQSKELNRFTSALPEYQLKMWGESLIQMVI
jgi:thioredoxin 2